MIKTEAGEKMKEENPIDGIDTIDGQELLRQELEKEGKKFGMPETPEMNMGGLMGDGMGVIIGIEAESGNEIPAGSQPEEVADDIPAMLSEGEYVVPADVVRWHGVKTFEGLRCEAKMGMGLMAQDGRIAEVDDEYEHGHDSPDYDIEEKDKPKVEKAEVEVVHAAEGVDLSPTEPTGGPYYGYRVVFDPEAGRYVFKAVDPGTQEYVTTQEFDPTKSTRYTPEALLGIGAEEETTQECPEGFYFDEEAGVCMPEKAPAPASVVQPDGGGDGPEDSPRVDYASQGLTKLAEALGPLSAEDLKDVEGDTLSDKAITRMTTPATPVSLSLNPFATLASIGKNIYDDVGARRAAETRAQELTKAVGLSVPEFNDPDYAAGVTAYNWNFNPSTGSFNASKPSSTITERQQTGTGTSWVTDFNHVGLNKETGVATEYSESSLGTTDNDGNFSWNTSVADDIMNSIENELSGMTAVTGDNNKSSVSSSSSSSRSSSGSTPTNPPSSTIDTSGYDRSSGGGGGGGGSTDSGSSAATASDNDSSDYSGYMNKGGYVSKKNKAKVATMQYSKGSK